MLVDAASARSQFSRPTMHLEPSPTGARSALSPISVSIACDRAINYAFQQNAIPFARELKLVNSGAEDLADLLVRITVEPAFALPLEIRIQALPATGEFRLSSIDLTLSPEFLASLTEKITGLLHVEIRSAASAHDAPLVRHTESITLLAPNEWCGLVSLPEILAAFVLPNDPAVMRILDRAAESLREHTGRAALNGYQDKSRERVWQQIAAIHHAIGHERLRYINPPASFELTGQKIRFPSDILAQQFATCLDLALLFAACCEQAGLHPLVLLHDGHAYAGCWLVDRTLAEPAIDDQQTIRKLVQLEELGAFELTVLTADDPGTLEKAALLAAPHLEPDTPFRLALDIRRARSARIHPLPLSGQSAPVNDRHPPPTSPAPSAGIGERTFIEPANAPTSAAPRPASRIDLWKSRLLDLSLRNRLLNFRPTKGTVQILSVAPEHVEDELAANGDLKLLPRPSVMGREDPRNATAYTRKQGADALNEHLREELQLGRLHTTFEAGDHQRRLTDLYRAARLALEENGTNTLFAAVGVLEWRETEHSDRTLRAPLLLVPVELKRKSVIEGFQLRRLDEDTRLNITLIEMLRQHFKKEIPGLDPLPEDENGVDVAAVFRLLRAAVRDLPGWEVKSELWLGQFSFTKFLLWKDLADRLDDLARNRVVRHLIQESGSPFPNPPEDIHAAELDDRFNPAEICCPRSADSSQLAAVMAAAAGHDFVLEGPPGTGKSQTITNIIAHCLAHGKRVLFVAEKRAALDVVHRRLKEEGLAPFCLELHSNKSGKGDVLAQFRESLDFAALPAPTDWTRHAAELQRLRDELNDYVRALHRRYPCGLSAHACLDYLLPRQDEAVIQLDWPDFLECDAMHVETCRDAARQLAQRAELLGDVSTHPLAPVRSTEWSPVWAERVRALLPVVAAHSFSAARAAADVREWLTYSSPSAARAELTVLRAFAATLLDAPAVPAPFITANWTPLAKDLDEWIRLATERQTLRAQLADYDEVRLLALDLAAFQQRWQAAQSSWFLLKWVKIGSLRRQLRTARNDGAKPVVDSLPAVLSHALRLREINASFAASAALASDQLGELWRNGEPTPEALTHARTWGETLHTQLVALAGHDRQRSESLRQQVASLFAAGVSTFARETDHGTRLSHFIHEWDAFETALDEFANTTTLDRDRLDAAPDYFGATAQLIAQIESGWRHIRAWCSWQKARASAEGSGLKPLCVAIGDGRVPVVDAAAWFERSFRRGLLDTIFGRDETLRTFFGHEHRGRIERFREFDQRITRLTRDLVRARLAAGIPRDQPDDVIPPAELGLLRKEIGKKTRHIPVRQLLARIPTLMPRLKPCVLMSPLSVAQYLGADHEHFNVVVFDEASQIPVWDAVGAIARGRQLIVVGDPKQLPPTNFFNRSDDGADADDDSLIECEDLESILDELLSNGVRHKRLQWHYRSRHEGLIAFSNRHYYENDLLTFPSPDVGQSGVRLRFVDARYDKGKSRTNRGEAEALVAELTRRLRDPGLGRRSFGVVTFSQAQQQLVENLLDEQRRLHPEIERHFDDNPPVEGEPVFVKNLENVQGDERDVILFSVCYGPDDAGNVSMNFGPLNRDGGERRLNVAITRAKHEVLVFTTLRSEHIDLARTRARGVRDLKLFLEYAERGPRALPATGGVTVAPASAFAAPPDSADEETRSTEFQQLIASHLRKAGHDVHCDIGCSGYKIDLAIVDPAAPDRYLIGIECDGTTYQQAATARDRDQLRQLVLEGLGWNLHRLWTTDWWHDPEGELEKLTAAIAAVAEQRK